MALLLETTVGDVVIDLDVEGSPELCRNVLKLAKARYYSSTLIYNVIPNRYCQLGDPRGDGTGGGCIHGLLDKQQEEDITLSTLRFLKSKGRVLTEEECRQRGMVVATEMNGIRDTIGSQFLMTLEGGEQQGLDGYIPNNTTTTDSSRPTYLSLGKVTEDDDGVLDKIHNCYCDAHGRPYADIRIERALVLYDPFDDPPGFQELLQKRGIVVNEKQNVTSSPTYERPPEEVVEHRISANQVDEDEDENDELNAQRQEKIAQQEDKSRAVVLEMLGDLPSADIKAPENVLFVCKLNSITQDEDLELIFSRFDPNVKVEIIRDHETGASLQYAFCEFATKKQCVEAYFKMNGALIDDRRIKVDFSQSVAKIWDRYNQKLKPQRLDATDTTMQQQSNHGSSRGRGGRGGRGGGGFQPNGGRGGRGQQQYRNGMDRGSAGGGSSRDYQRRRDDRSPPRERDDRQYHSDHHRDRYRDDYREDRRHHHHGDYSTDDISRRRRSRSPSPDEERSRDYKRRRHHHSRKRDRRDRSQSRGDNERRRRFKSRSPARRRHDSKDNGHYGSSEEDVGESQSRQREDHDKDRHHRQDEERRHRKKHHRRNRDDRHKSKRKHRRHSRSRSRS